MPPIKKFTGNIFVTFKDGNTGSFSFSYDTYAEDRNYSNQVPQNKDHEVWYKEALDKFLKYVNETMIPLSNYVNETPLNTNILPYLEGDIQTVSHSISGSGYGATSCSQCGPTCNAAYPCGCSSGTSECVFISVGCFDC
jgi:hypothetical protein